MWLLIGTKCIHEHLENTRNLSSGHQVFSCVASGTRLRGSQPTQLVMSSTVSVGIARKLQEARSPCCSDGGKHADAGAAEGR